MLRGEKGDSYVLPFKAKGRDSTYTERTQHTLKKSFEGSKGQREEQSLCTVFVQKIHTDIVYKSFLGKPIMLMKRHDKKTELANAYPDA